MAISVNCKDKAARQDTLLVNPNDVSPGKNARMIPAPNYADQVRERALDIATNRQLQPVEVRRDADNSLILTFGFTRRDAIILLREGFLLPDGTECRQEGALLWVKVVDATEDEAFDRGIAENRQRNDTTDLQEAKAQEYYRTKRGLNDTEIARKYGYTNQNRIMDLKKLLTLSESIQTLVHEGKMSLRAALDTLGIEEGKREAVVAAATKESGKVSGPEVRKAVREAAEPGEKPAPKRTVKEFKEFAREVLRTNEYSSNVKNLFDTLAGWFDAEKSDKQLENAIDKLGD